MAIDSTPQPCPRCSRATVLLTQPWGRQWVHLGTWRPQCESSLFVLDPRPQQAAS